jgi:O-antigen/teichoic acid export membrane protein
MSTPRNTGLKFLGLAFWVGMQKGGGAIALLLFNALAARALSIAEFGIVVLLQSIALIFPVIAQLGANHAANRYLPVTEAGTKRRLVMSLLGMSLVAALTMALPLLVFTDKVLFQADWQLTALLAAWLLSSTLRSTVTECLRGLYRIAAASWFGGTVTWVVALVALYYFVSASDGPSSMKMALFAIALGNVLSTLASLTILATSLPSETAAEAPVSGKQLSGLAALIRKCSPYWVISVCTVLLMNIDVATLKLFALADDVGIYGAAKSLAQFMFTVMLVFVSIIMPYASSLLSKGQQRRIALIVQGVSAASLFVTLPLILAFLLAGESALGSIFGDEFAAAHTSLLILCSGLIVNSASGARGTLLMMGGFAKLQMILSVAGMIMCGALCLLGAYTYGIEGVALAVTISVTTQCLFEAVFVKRKLGFSPWATLPGLIFVVRQVFGHGR